MREWEFEQRLCAHLEGRGELVARQLGAGVHSPGNRVVDVLLVDRGPGFEARTQLTQHAIPALSVVATVGAGRARYWKDTIRDLDVHPERGRAAVERAIEVGFLEAERRNGRTYVRQAARYPEDWFSGLAAIENKPDLENAGDLTTQLRTDVSAAVVDRVVLATASHVTQAHLHRLPAEVGVWRFDPDESDLDVVREPAQLPVDEPGIELLDRQPSRDDVRVVDSEAKAKARLRLAERAYGKGWRPAALPGCTYAERRQVDGIDGLSRCAHFDRIVNPATECGEQCPAFESDQPPSFDREAIRDRYSPWLADPTGRARRQGSLDGFAE